MSSDMINQLETKHLTLTLHLEYSHSIILCISTKFNMFVCTFDIPTLVQSELWALQAPRSNVNLTLTTKLLSVLSFTAN